MESLERWREVPIVNCCADTLIRHCRHCRHVGKCADTCRHCRHCRHVGADMSALSACVEFVIVRPVVKKYTGIFKNRCVAVYNLPCLIFILSIVDVKIGDIRHFCKCFGILHLLITITFQYVPVQCKKYLGFLK